MSAFRITILEPTDYSVIALDNLRRLGTVHFGYDLKALEYCTILVVRLHYKIDRGFLTKCPNLKFILSATTGTDHIDLQYCNVNNIEVVCLKGEEEFLGTIPSTAEHAWTLLMSLVRNIPQACQHVKNLNWNRDQFRGHNLNNLRLGILGYGRVGKQVARIAKVFMMEIHVFDVKPINDEESIVIHHRYEEFAKHIDILSIHIPLDESTIHWLNKDRLNLLNEGAYIVNTSRGKVWDETHVVELLKRNYLKGCATDVIELEQEGDGKFKSPLIQAMNQNLPIIITPHIAGATFESMAMTEEFVVKKLFNKYFDEDFLIGT